MMAGADAPGTPAPVRVTVVVPVYNAMRFLPQTVPALLEALAAHRAAELVIVDNGSTDGSPQWVAGHAAAARQLARPGATISALRNAGAQAGTGALLSFVDADCVVPPGYFVTAERVMMDRAIAGCGSRYLLPENPHWVERVWQHLHDEPEHGQAIYVPAGNFVVRRSAFQAVGGFREDLVTGEDADLGLRLTERGYVIRQSPEVSVRHLGNPRSLAAFYRKQRWHALGMFGTVRRNRIDKPVAMTFAHLAALLTVVILAVRDPVAGLVSLATLAWLIPLVTVIFRVLKGGRVAGSALPAAVLLYQLYYLARIAALGRIALGRGRP